MHLCVQFEILQEGLKNLDYSWERTVSDALKISFDNY